MDVRVGVVSSDSSLLVELALRGNGLSVVPVDHVAALVGHDVALVDVPAGEDAASVARSVPEGPATVLLCTHEVEDDLEGVVVVRRPCSVGDVLDALDAAVAAQPVPTEEPADPVRPAEPRDEPVIVVDDTAHTVPREPEPEPASTPDTSAPVADAPPAPTVEPRPAAPAAPPPPPEPSPPPVEPPPPTVDIDLQHEPTPPPPRELLTERLDDAVGQATSARGLADAVATVLLDTHHADHVALWRQDGDHYVVLGADGLTPGARRMELADQHPVLQIARANDGTLFRDEFGNGPRAPGMPGTGSAAYALVILDEVTAPVDLVTISADHLPRQSVDQLTELLAHATTAWRDREARPG